MSVVVVTGAGGALGSALCRHLASNGIRVAAVDSARSRVRVEKLAGELGGGALGLAFDVASATDWATAMPRIDAVGPITGAALVAGSWAGGAALHAEKDDAVLRSMLSANLETADKTMRALLPGMVSRGAGSVVLVGSRAVERPWQSAGASAYAASKAALVALGEAVAAEVLPHGVRINSVLASTIDTPSNRAAMPAADFGKWVSTESLSTVIAFLLGDGARDISGAAIPVYGGA